MFVDEIHKYPAWQTLIKNIADEYPDLHIVFTGSTMLKIDKSQGDLSRRMRDYTLNVMSFREFLEFEGVTTIPSLSLSKEITYPTIQKLLRMLMILAERVPQTPKMNELYAILETNREQGLRMLYLLQRAGLLHLLSTETKEFQNMTKPDKIYLHDTNLMYALSENANIGTLRETFFINQVSAISKINYPRKGDFIVNSKQLFEVGGKTRNSHRLKMSLTVTLPLMTRKLDMAIASHFGCSGCYTNIIPS